MKKNNNFFSEDFEDFKPKKTKIAKKSRQVSFNELDTEDNFYQQKRKKNVDYKRY